MFGLVLFVDGLRVAIMPMGSMLGQQLPEKFKVRYILIIACAVGILCTYAEPAIASLRPLADLVKRCDTPYLYFVLNDMSEILVLSIGVGVGVAAMIGVLRFLRGWSLKPLIACSLTPTIAMACYMKWGNPDLSPLIGLAWDCGAVTTGPVTVPILLSLGIGVMKGQKARATARQVLCSRARVLGACVRERVYVIAAERVKWSRCATRSLDRSPSISYIELLVSPIYSCSLLYRAPSISHTLLLPSANIITLTGALSFSRCLASLRQAVEEKAGTASGGQALEGFGIITLASTFPILAVEVWQYTTSSQLTTRRNK